MQGTEPALYPLVGPLVMNPEVLKQNMNYPFKTTEHFVWYIAMNGHSVIGFVPVEHRGKEYIINNYYVTHKDREVLMQLLSRMVLDHLEKLPRRVECQEQHEGAETAFAHSFYRDKPTLSLGYKLTAICLKEDVECFRTLGFVVQRTWARYIKLTIE